MSDLAIRVEGLGKCYRVRPPHPPADRPLHRLGRALRQWAADLRPPSADEQFWALRDVSFEVRRGEVLGIIGHNGAGKSTLLKILSRVTDPSTGRAELHGRVGSLLEVGTGFHPDLTGRENVYLSGTILGMSRREIDGHFDAIVDFAEIDRFIDTPVKRYSSGMYVRLAFAVAAHLEPEILIVDEVLAVGDVSFQAKCIGRMRQVASSGATVLLVSHNPFTIEQLASRTIRLHHGVIQSDLERPVQPPSEPRRCIETSEYSFEFEDLGRAAFFRRAAVRLPDFNLPQPRDLEILLDYEVLEWRLGDYVSIQLFDEQGNTVFWAADAETPEDILRQRPRGRYRGIIHIPVDCLLPGDYSLSLSIYSPGQAPTDLKDCVLHFPVSTEEPLLSHYGLRYPCSVRMPFTWQTHVVKPD